MLYWVSQTIHQSSGEVPLNSLFKKILMAVGITLLTFNIVSAADIDKATKDNIFAKLQQANPSFPINKVKIATSPIPNLYRIMMPNDSIIYATKDGEHIIVGEMYSVGENNFVNLDSLSPEQKRLKVLAAIAPEDMIIYPAIGETKSYVTIFTDVDCPYCVKLHKEVPAIQAKGIEVRYLGYPREGIYTPSHSKLASAWCSSDPKEMLPRLQQGEAVDLLQCDKDPVIQHWYLGDKIGVKGRTPALVSNKGELWFGYHSADKLAKKLKLN